MGIKWELNRRIQWIFQSLYVNDKEKTNGAKQNNFVWGVTHS